MSQLLGQLGLIGCHPGAHVRCKNLVDGRHVGFDVGYSLVDFGRCRVKQSAGYGKAVVQVTRVDLCNLIYGLGAIFKHGFQGLVGFADAVKAQSANDNKKF